MSLYDSIVERKEKIAVVGLGYVGMPLAVAFAQIADVTGFDLNGEKILKYRSGIDPTREVGDQAIKDATVDFTADPAKLKEARFIIVAVPTPINSDKTPDLSPVEEASRIVGANLSKGTIVVYESTVYPGVTEDICVPILEKGSGLKCGQDFRVGYSPERINPGDRIHRLENIVKIVSGMDRETLDEIAAVYGLVIRAGVYRAGSIRVAEAAKVAENSQRDINIAFMNELAMVFDRMHIDTTEVVDAMNTKWNALGFKPGLVGGHCIGVDPYYFIYEAEKLGYHSQIILSGRKINDGMGKFAADSIIKQLVLAGKTVRQSRVVIFGITFKENTPDVRNSRVLDIIQNLREYGIVPVVVDPVTDASEVKRAYGIDIADLNEVRDADCLVLAVAHDCFRELPLEEYGALFADMENEQKVLIDIKSILNKSCAEKLGYRYWRL